MNNCEFDALIEAADRGGAYVRFPWNLREKYGKGRMKVHAAFDGEPYDGSIVNMGVKTRMALSVGFWESERTSARKSARISEIPSTSPLFLLFKTGKTKYAGSLVFQVIRRIFVLISLSTYDL